MIDLRPCSRCRRHVRFADESCPFCGAALAAPVAHRIPRGRLSRAAVFASAATLAACGGKKEEQAKPPAGSGSATGSAEAVPAAADAAPTPDAALADAAEAAPADAAAPPDAGDLHKPIDKKHVKKKPDEAAHPPVHPNPKPYGAPPARKRIV